MSSHPDVSVIIVSYNSKNTIGDCLNSLKKQRAGIRFEIIVIDSSEDGAGEFVEKHFQSIRLYRFSKRKYPGDARNIGISLARGDIVAFIDADCVAEENWIEALTKAHERHYHAIGGAIGNANPTSYVGWGAYFCEFSRWMPETLRQPMDDIPTANMSYKKTLFERFGYFIEGTYSSDTEFNWRLAKHGIQLNFDPSIRVSHYNIQDVNRFITHEMFHGFSFAMVRTRSMRFSGLRRAAYSLSFPLIAVRLGLKAIRFNLKNRVYFKQFVQTLPLTLLGVLCWTLGEAVGYVARNNEHRERF
jgi:glycosyltransferase involved in cell wall biosynthesis